MYYASSGKLELPITRREGMVREAAYFYYMDREPTRKRWDFFLAIADCGIAFTPVSPSDRRWNEIQKRANQRWLARKDADALQDRLDAEKQIDENYDFYKPRY